MHPASAEVMRSIGPKKMLAATKTIARIDALLNSRIHCKPKPPAFPLQRVSPVASVPHPDAIIVTGRASRGKLRPRDFSNGSNAPTGNHLFEDIPQKPDVVSTTCPDQAHAGLSL